MIYDVDLDDGRTVTLEADNPPSEQDIYAALQSYQPPAPRPQLQPGDLAGPEARQIPDLTTTTSGITPSAPPDYSLLNEPLPIQPSGGIRFEGVNEPPETIGGMLSQMVLHEGITIPGLSEAVKKAGEQYVGGLGIRGVSKPIPPEQFTPTQKLASGAIQGVDELVEGVANFLSSSQGIAETGAAASPIAPAVYLKWANDMVRGGMLNAGEAYDAYKRGDWETFAKQVTGGLGMLLGAGAVTRHGISKIAEPIQAFTGGTPRLEEANAKALAATIPPEIPSITKAGETYASPIRSDTGQILEAGQIPETSENVSGQNLQLAPPGQPEPVVPRVEQRPQAEVVPAVEPSKVEATPIDRAQRFQDLKQAEAEGRLDEEGAAELADLIAADDAAKAEQKRIAAEFKASQETTPPAPTSETAAVTEIPVNAEPKPTAVETYDSLVANAKTPEEIQRAREIIENAKNLPKSSRDAYLAELPSTAQSPPPPEPKAKEPWEMTKAEWSATIKKEYGRQGFPDLAAKQATDATHAKEVADAVNSGKPVPPEVLADYPDIKPPATSAATPVTPAQAGGKVEKRPVMNMAGQVRQKRAPFAGPPAFETLHPKAQEKFNAAWNSKDASGMNELLGLQNKGLRGEFARRTGVKLPNTVGGTKNTIDSWSKGAFDKPTPPPTPPTPPEPISQGPGETQGAVVTKVAPLAPAANPAPSLTPKSQRLIINDLAKGLNLPIRFGRLTTTKYAGYFKRVQNLIGAKKPNDVPVVSHEVGHKLDATFSLSSDPTISSELDMLGDPATPGSGSSWTPSKSKAYKMGEGVAEFTRYWLTDPDHARTQAPNTFRAFENALNSNKDLGDTMRQAQSDIQVWKNAEPQARLRSHISIGENPNKTRYTTSQLTRDLVDDLHFVRLAVEHAERGAGSPLPPSRNPYLLARNLRGSYGMADTFIRSGIVDFNSKEVKLGTSLEDALKPVAGRLADFRDWMVAKRAQELHAQGRQTGLVDSDVNFTANKFNSDPIFQKAFDDVKQWQDSLLDYAVDSGLIERGSPATATEPATGSFAIREMNQDYVPFHRVFEVGAAEPASQQAMGIGMGLNVGKPGSLKRLKGSQRDIVDPLETMVKNAYTIITASEKAAINRAVAEMANLPDMGRWVERVAAPKSNVEFPLSRIRDQLDRAGANTTALADDLLLNFFRPTGSAPFGENIIRVVRNGENQFYRLNRDLHDTFQALDLEDSGKIIRILSQPAQLLRAGVVLEPSFTVANALRDTFSSAVIGKYGAVPFETTLRGVAALIGNPKLVSEWAASGGRSAVEASYFDRPKLQRFLAERISKDLTPAERALVVAKSPLTALRWLTGLSEEATRIGEYQKAYNSLTKSGMPEGEARRMAAFEARDRQDFAKGGAKTKIVRHLAAFWNAALQANVKLAQSFKQRPVRTTLQGLAYITTAKLLEQAVNWNDPDYWDRQQWERDLFFMIPIGKDASGHTRFLRIPTPFEVGLIFGTLPGRFMQWAKTHRPDAVKGLPSLILKQSVPNPTPSAVQLPFELIPDKGWDFFRGRQIVPESVADLPPESQWTEQTSALAKSVGKQLGVSPLKVDHAISQTTGGLGKLVSGRQAPGQRFVTAPLAVSNQPVQDFYDTLGKLRQLDQQMKLSGQNQHPSHLQDFEEASRKLSTLRKKAREATDEKAKADFQNQLFETAKSQMERYRAGQSSGKPRRIKPVTRQK